MIKINGKLVEYKSGMTILDLFNQKRLDPEGHTVMLNGKIVPWDQLAEHELEADDDVRIIFLISGG